MHRELVDDPGPGRADVRPRETALERDPAVVEFRDLGHDRAEFALRQRWIVERTLELLIRNQRSARIESPSQPRLRHGTSTTLAGVAALACFIREYDLPAYLWGRSMNNLNMAEASLRAFIYHLAAIT